MPPFDHSASSALSCKGRGTLHTHFWGHGYRIQPDPIWRVPIFFCLVLHVLFVLDNPTLHYPVGDGRVELKRAKRVVHAWRVCAGLKLLHPRTAHALRLVPPHWVPLSMPLRERKPEAGFFDTLFTVDTALIIDQPGG